jgi:hypothetical protein
MHPFHLKKIYIERGLCLPSPHGCGQDVGHFPTLQSSKTYQTTGLCPTCQQKQIQHDQSRLGNNSTNDARQAS